MLHFLVRVRDTAPFRSASTWTRLIDLAKFERASGIFASVFFDD
jgi:hypothetical protein